MHKQRRPWTDEELRLLIAAYDLAGPQHAGLDALSDLLGRTAGAISQKAGQLGLSPSRCAPVDVTLRETHPRIGGVRP